MKNLPRKIYLQIKGCPDDANFKELIGVTFCDKRAFKDDIEYIRSDVAEQMAKDFKCFIDEAQKYSVEDEYTKFINSRKAQKK